MFGYIKPQKSELRVRESECYNATYCGLCRSMGSTCGKSFCGALSYDFAFLAVVRMSILGEKPEFEYKRCIAHPLRKRAMAKNNKSLEYSSAAAALLGYGKCLDDIADERGFKRFKAKLALPYFKRARKKALKKLPHLIELDERIKDLLAEMSSVEADTTSEPSADRMGEIFGKIIGEIMSFGLEGGEQKSAFAFGRAIGHWLYLVDAADDYAEDEKKKRYNPYRLLFGDERGFDKDRRARVSEALVAHLMDGERALDLIECRSVREYYEIMRNILYLGMPAEAKKALGIEN